MWDRKETHSRRARSEYQPSRRAITLLLALLVIAVGAFAYYCYQFVERQTVVPQSASAAPITTPEPKASPSVEASKKRESQAYAPVEITTLEPQEIVASEPISTPLPPASAQYRCDGRTRCSQMTSCSEATFFLRNCPGTQMDGDSDGIPCEQQWCGN
jgi:Excalibur calcium-binding domain